MSLKYLVYSAKEFSHSSKGLIIFNIIFVFTYTVFNAWLSENINILT